MAKKKSKSGHGQAQKNGKSSQKKKKLSLSEKKLDGDVNEVKNDEEAHSKKKVEDETITENLNNALLHDDSTTDNSQLESAGKKNNDEHKDEANDSEITPFKKFISEYNSIEKEKNLSANFVGNARFDAASLERGFFGTSTMNNNTTKQKNKNMTGKAEPEFGGFSGGRLTERGGRTQLLPGGDLKTIEDYIALGVPRTIAVMKHPLQHTWSFWYFENKKDCSWEENLQNIASVNTVEDFWQVYNYIDPASKLKSGCDYALFKKGIMPDWEDVQNSWGGRWLVSNDRGGLFTREQIDDQWLEVLFILIGEHAGRFAGIVNGAVINIRNKVDKIAVWLSSQSQQDGVMEVGQLVKQRLGLHNKIFFSVHDEDRRQPQKRYGSNSSPGKFFV